MQLRITLDRVVDSAAVNDGDIESEGIFVWEGTDEEYAEINIERKLTVAIASEIIQEGHRKADEIATAAEPDDEEDEPGMSSDWSDDQAQAHCDLLNAVVREVTQIPTSRHLSKAYKAWQKAFGIARDNVMSVKS